MKGQRLFVVLGEIDPELVEEALGPAPARRSSRLRSWGALAACLAVICIGAAMGQRLGSGTDSLSQNTASGESAEENYTEGAIPEESFTEDVAAPFSYAGPVLPLTTNGPVSSLTARRTLTWDFPNGSDAQSSHPGASVTDSYVLTNTASESISTQLLYPIAASLADLASLDIQLTTDGAETAFAFLPGAYAGGFVGTSLSDDGSWNLAGPSCWEDYASLLADGSYRRQALSFSPSSLLDQTVSIYAFSDFTAPEDAPRAATQAVEVTFDPQETTILTYGFNGLTWDESAGWYQYNYFLPRKNEDEDARKFLLVLGEDISGYTLQGYADGGCRAGDELEGISCTVTRFSSTLGQALDTLCQEYLAYSAPGSDSSSPLTTEIFSSCVGELLTQYGPLSDNPIDRYALGRLDDILAEALTLPRVIYLQFPVTLSPESSLTLSLSYRKAASFFFDSGQEETADLEYYDLATSLDSSLDFTDQSVILTNAGRFLLAEENLGFHTQGEKHEASLDPACPYYSFAVRLR